jgi:hypothetical protein
VLIALVDWVLNRNALETIIVGIQKPHPLMLPNVPLPSYCERSVGTVFQLPNPDAIYSRDEEKERGWLPSLVVCVRARFTRQGGGPLPR